MQNLSEEIKEVNLKKRLKSHKPHYHRCPRANKGCKSPVMFCTNQECTPAQGPLCKNCWEEAVNTPPSESTVKGMSYNLVLKNMA